MLSEKLFTDLLPSHDGLLINVGRGKPATQSSHYDATIEGSTRALNGRKTGGFAFHTQLEANPWWMVDLQSPYAIYQMMIFNREDAASDLAKNLVIEFSLSGDEWSVVYESRSEFGGVGSGTPLTVYFGDAEVARFVRLSLPGTTYLHLDQVEIYSSLPALRLKRLCHENNLDFIAAITGMAPWRPEKIDVIKSASDPSDYRIAMLKLRELGLFGNRILQLLHAAHAARKLSIPRILYPERYIEGAPLNYSDAIIGGGVSICDAFNDNEINGNIIECCPMYGDGAFRHHIADMTPDDYKSIIEQLILPALDDKLKANPYGISDRDILVHIRSGDVFTSNPAPLNYPQPPLSYYILAIEHAMRIYGCVRVVVVYQCTANPVVGALLKWLANKSIPFDSSSSELIDDMAHLINGKYIVSSVGSFIPALLLLSNSVEVVYFFRGEFVAGPIEIKKLCYHIVRDLENNYTKIGEWLNNAEQRAQMLEYPIESLAFK